MSITSHLTHTTSLCIEHIGKVSHNQRVICIILIYNVPRTGQASLRQKRMLPGTTWPHTAPFPAPRPWQPTQPWVPIQPFLRSCWPPKPERIVTQEKVCCVQLGSSISFFSPSKHRGGSHRSSQTPGVQIFSKKENETNETEREGEKDKANLSIFHLYKLIFSKFVFSR